MKVVINGTKDCILAVQVSFLYVHCTKVFDIVQVVVFETNC